LLIPIAFLFAILWIVFVTNAMNWLDGSPGIVSGTSAIASLVIYFLAAEKNLHVIDQSTLSIMALIIAGASIAFLLFDFPKPRVLMGDSGTMFLGFLISIMAIFNGAKFATVFIVLGIPILDALWTIGRRLLSGKSPFRGDFQHLHHDLLRAGLTERQVNLVYYSVSFGFGLVSLFLHSFGKLIAISALLILITAIRILILSSRP
jgi:UDP-N-acetylmuramyl pentapeptide phosphotransferase/UDP-N-acetylglucosamine-1-phosphate transferase